VGRLSPDGQLVSAPTSSPSARGWLPFALLFALVLGCLALLWAVPPGTQRTVDESIAPPFEAGSDGIFYAWARIPVRWNRKAPAEPMVVENGKALRPARFVQQSLATQEDVTRAERIELMFSPSDRSDPNRNGRSYAVRYEAPRLPIGLYLATVVCAAFAGFLILALAVDRGLRRWPRLRGLAMAGCSVLFLVAALEGGAAVLLADRLAASPPAVTNAYAQVFGATPSGSGAGMTSNYRPHPYLNFALNPAAAYMDERQFNAEYSIRRGEPIRPRSEVAWRALALGGSTTFGEKTQHERDTWVYRLEEKMRAAHGPDYDVINGGVGGYNVVENLIHYMLLLDALDPDVVILYVGINDVHPRLMGDLARDYTNSRIPYRGESTTLPVANPALARSALYRLRMLREVEARTYAHIYLYVQGSYPPVDEWPAALQHNGPEVYQAHLEDLVRLILAQGHRVVIVPQVFVPAPHNAQDLAFDIGVREHNLVNARVAEQYRCPLVDLKPEGFGRKELIDNCHFTPQGHEKMATELFDFLQSDPRLTARRTQ
jgi:lysophospholipase L1-like esterase